MLGKSADLTLTSTVRVAGARAFEHHERYQDNTKRKLGKVVWSDILPTAKLTGSSIQTHATLWILECQLHRNSAVKISVSSANGVELCEDNDVREPENEDIKGLKFYMNFMKTVNMRMEQTVTKNWRKTLRSVVKQGAKAAKGREHETLSQEKALEPKGD